MKNKLPDRWKEIELRDAGYFEVKKGESITKSKISDGYVPVVAGGQQPAYYHNKSNRQGETITISGSGAYAGFVAYFNVPIFASDCSTVQTKTESISTRYTYLFLKSYQRRIYSLQKGIAQPHVYPKDIMKIKIPLPFSNGKPDLKEQEIIVGILEKAESLKQKGKKAGDLLDEYLKSVFYEMFYNRGFEEIKIENGTLKTDTKNPMIDFPDNNFYYVDIASIDTERKEIVNYNKLIGKEAPSRARQQIKKKDVLVSTVRPNLNAVALVPTDLDNQICSTGFCILRADNKKFTPEYLFYTSQINSFINSLVRKCKGANYPAVSNKDVKSFKIPLPPLPLQQKFAKIVEHVERLKENVNKAKRNSGELFNALMQKAFNGELIK